MDCAIRQGQDCELVSLGTFHDKSGKVGDIEVRQCPHCGHGVTFPPIPDVRFLYGERESQDYQPDTKNSLSRTIKELAFRNQASKLASQLGDPGASLLDFGCGSGQFTRVLDETLTGTKVTGSDFFDTPPAELRGHSYAPADEIAQRERVFDTVMAMHVLEHDDDVAGLLARIVRPARPGGKVVVEVPNVECFWGSVFGRFWDAWYVPYHRNHFSRRSLVRFLEAQGLEVEAVHGITAPTMGRTVANLFGRKNNVFWLALGVLLHPVQWLGEKLSGQPTAIRVIARKR